MKRMLINATQPEELRVALVDGQRLFDLDIEAVGKEQRKSNIYKARIIRLEPSLEAAFVDYGVDRHGFLPLKEVSRHLFREKFRNAGGRVNIRDALEEGQELIVQVEKDERGNKGAALTTFVSLAGRYLVAMPHNPKAGGVSRQIEGDAREEAKEAMASLTIPDDFGLILRTAGIGQSAEELQWDLDYLLQLWQAVDTAAKGRAAPVLLHKDQNVVIRAIRDYLRADIAEILVDDPALYQVAVDFMQQVMPQNIGKLKLYTDSVPLFTRYQIEGQIDGAFSREVRLPSGGALVIEPTEALITIDINSARATHGSDIEETALLTNLEAAEEIATQLRLRDLGGLVVVDFIDMMSAKNQRAVENKMRDCVKMDRARVQIGRISRFGLLEMSRQRLRPSLAEFSHELCPRCNGVGTILSLRSTALTVLRVLEEEAMKDSTSKVVAEMPVDVATFLFNEKRRDISRIEERQEVEIILVPNQNLETPHFNVQRIREQDLAKKELGESYQLVTETAAAPALDYTKAPPALPEQAAVRDIVRNTHQVAAPEAPASAAPEAPRGGLLRRVFGSLFGGGGPADTPATPPTVRAQPDTRPARSEGVLTPRTSGQTRAATPGGERGRDDQRRRSSEPRRGRGGRGGEGQRGRGEGESRGEDQTRAPVAERRDATEQPSRRSGERGERRETGNRETVKPETGNREGGRSRGARGRGGDGRAPRVEDEAPIASSAPASIATDETQAQGFAPLPIPSRAAIASVLPAAPLANEDLVAARPVVAARDTDAGATSPAYGTSHDASKMPSLPATPTASMAVPSFVTAPQVSEIPVLQAAPPSLTEQVAPNVMAPAGQGPIPVAAPARFELPTAAGHLAEVRSTPVEAEVASATPVSEVTPVSIVVAQGEPPTEARAATGDNVNPVA